MAGITTKVPALQALIEMTEIDKSLRILLGESQSLTLSITLDPSGTSVNFSTQESGGISENYNKRSPYVAPEPEESDSPESPPQ